MSVISPYGTWPSPLTAARVTAGLLRFDHLVVDGGDLYWSEGRASEGGRSVVVRRSSTGEISDVTPVGFNVRTRVHEYGGAAFTVHEGSVIFSHFADQRLYRQDRDSKPTSLTGEGYRYADARVDRAHSRLIAVREDQTGPGEARNEIVAVSLTGAVDKVLVTGADFYSDPIVSPDARWLAWLQWNHPQMPWDGTELWIASIDGEGRLGEQRRLAGHARESIFQPQWSPDGRLYCVSDRTGWWNLYHVEDSALVALLPMAAEFGKPQWTFSQSTYDFLDAERIAATYCERGRWRLGVLDVTNAAFAPIALECGPTDGVVAVGGDLFFIGGSPTEAYGIWCLSAAVVANAKGRGSEVPREATLIRSASRDRVDPAWLSQAEAITFPSRGVDVHAFFYAPRNPLHAAPDGERPPLIVMSHGGPTAAATDVLDARLQFWTSRGFAVLDVNYGGSTGYGRAYRERLHGLWGIVDVEDCVNGARHLVARGGVDRERLAIRGGSAGGYTTLAALTFHDLFTAGASYYGVSDVEMLARDTHKFESRYLDSLIGPYPAERALYQRRSPLHAVDQLSAALIVFQGLEDKVVPPEQAEVMVAAARAKGLPVAYLAFAGEQHGFRRAENIVRCLEAELLFYAAVFGFVPADEIAPLPIDNLPR